MTYTVNHNVERTEEKKRHAESGCGFDLLAESLCGAG